MRETMSSNYGQVYCAYAQCLFSLHVACFRTGKVRSSLMYLATICIPTSLEGNISGRSA